MNPRDLKYPRATPSGGVYPYIDDKLVIPEYDGDQSINPCNERAFAAQADMRDGTSGCKQIDTRYENFSEAQVNVPRSDLDSPSIRGMKPNHSGVDVPAPYSIDKDQYPHRRM
jgi:hypothetical protein